MLPDLHSVLQQSKSVFWSSLWVFLAAISSAEFWQHLQLYFGASNGRNDGCLSDSCTGNGQHIFQSFLRILDTYPRIEKCSHLPASLLRVDSARSMEIESMWIYDSINSVTVFKTTLQMTFHSYACTSSQYKQAARTTD